MTPSPFAESPGPTAEQAALRRIAQLVADDSPRQTIFAAVVHETQRVLLPVYVGLVQRESDHRLVTVAQAGTTGVPSMGYELDGDSVLARVLASGLPARLAAYSEARGAQAAHARALGYGSGIGAPIIVAGRLWGVLVASFETEHRPTLEHDQQRLAEFSDLIAIAIANTEGRAALRELAEEQAMLRRVATLVAEGQSPGEILSAVAGELAVLIGADTMGLLRIEAGDTAHVLADLPAGLPGVGAGMRVGVDEVPILRRVLDSGAPQMMSTADIDEEHPVRQVGLRTLAGAPILVGGRAWGFAAAGWTEEPGELHPDTLDRLAEFCHLVAIAIENADSRDALRQLVSEQSALRRIATLVAQGTAPAEVFRAIAREAGTLMRVDATILARFEPDGTATVMAHETIAPMPVRAGDVLSLEGDSAMARVRRTGGPARIDTYEGAGGQIAELQRAASHVVSAGAPVTVEGRLWGALVVTWMPDQPMPAKVETRLTEFTELIAAAIANSESRSELAASRARVLVAADEARRRIQRDLHDGAQQRLVSLALEVREAQHAAAEVAAPDRDLDARFERIVHGLSEAGDELQYISRGLHPAGLERGGLDRALRTLTRQAAIPVALMIGLADRLPEPLEVAAFYVVSEAVTNAVKHAGAEHVTVEIREADGELTVRVADDGGGGADPTRGTGLIGLRDRVEALGGRLELRSVAGGGTTIAMRVAIAAQPARPDPFATTG